MGTFKSSTLKTYTDITNTKRTIHRCLSLQELLDHWQRTAALIYTRSLRTAEGKLWSKSLFPPLSLNPSCLQHSVRLAEKKTSNRQQVGQSALPESLRMKLMQLLKQKKKKKNQPNQIPVTNSK